jgi:hypothetical protein
MEVLLGVGIVLGAVLVLCLIAFTIRRVLVWFAIRKGYTADNMPMHYHVIGFGVYFSILYLVHIVYLTTN